MDELGGEKIDIVHAVLDGLNDDADRFREILPQYQRQPSLFVQQRLTETLGRVLTNVQDKIFVAESVDGKPKELRLLLNRELLKKAE